MSKRLQVLLEESEWAELNRIARRHRTTTAAWVRQVLRAAARAEPLGGAKKKLEVVREAVRHRFPTADIDAMLQEIEQGYSSGGR